VVVSDREHSLFSVQLLNLCEVFLSVRCVEMRAFLDEFDPWLPFSNRLHEHQTLLYFFLSFHLSLFHPMLELFVRVLIKRA
jgi:hypothetical protein